MDTFEPLVELRGEWRQAAAISVPAAAAQVAAALDRALDVLVDADQVDEESLTMAAETVCKAVVARSDEVELLRRRLHRAVRDFVTVIAVDNMPMSTDSGAFDSEEALAAALFASVGESISAEDLEPPPSANAGKPRKIDEKALKRTLADRPAKTRKAVVSGIKLAIPVLAVIGISIYVLTHPELFTRTTSTDPGASGPASTCQVSQTVHAGCFEGDKATCLDGTPRTGACRFSFQVLAAGKIKLTLHWDSGDSLSVALLKPDGTPVAPPVTAKSGTAVLTLPTVPAGDYLLEVTNATHAAGPIHFNVST